jgi:hypothetical protein
MSAYRSLTAVLALLTAALGVVMLALTLSGGGGIGVVLGLLFVAAGGGRLYLMRRKR